MRADAELPWYFGTGPSTWAGDAGLRSNLGGQVAHLEASKLSPQASLARAADRADPWRRTSDPRWHPERWQAPASQPSSVDVSAVEEGMIDRLSAGALASEVEARLACLSALHVRALRLHYSGQSLPFDVDPAAVLLAAARLACGTVEEAPQALMRGALARFQEADRATLARDAKALVKAAQVAYEDAPVPRVRRVQVNDPRER